jgi:hypothetical protein
MTHKAAGRESTKNILLKKAPFRPQVHTADIPQPQDSRRQMDKKAKIS